MSPTPKANLTQPPLAELLGFYDMLLAGDAAGLAALFADEPRLDVPLRGEIRGREALQRYVEEQQAWLVERRARAEFLDATISPRRFVAELVLYLWHDGEEIDLPVALAADRQGRALSALRIYHSTWPLRGHHTVRPPILEAPDKPPEEPAVVRAYMTGLAAGDKDLVLSLFSDDGYARQPSGARFKHAGPEGLESFYGPALSQGGIGLRHCTATVDDHACAVEFIAYEWAHVALPPQAGLAVYELAGPDKIRAARIYDDVSPPMETG